MGNCCMTPWGADDGGKTPKQPKQKKGKKSNPFSIDYNRSALPDPRLMVLREPTGWDISVRYELGGELGRGEFGVTYLCTDRASGGGTHLQVHLQEDGGSPPPSTSGTCAGRSRTCATSPSTPTSSPSGTPTQTTMPSTSSRSSARVGSSSTGSSPGDTTPSAQLPWSLRPLSRSCRCGHCKKLAPEYERRCKFQQS